MNRQLFLESDHKFLCWKLLVFSKKKKVNFNSLSKRNDGIKRIWYNGYTTEQHGALVTYRKTLKKKQLKKDIPTTYCNVL